MFVWRAKDRHRVSRLLRQHFGATPIERLLAASRTFPVTSRVDLQVALDKLFAERFRARLVGVHPEFCHETLTISHLASDGQMPVLVGALQHDEIDVGEAMPARCLKHGLWLARSGRLPFAVLLTPAERFSRETGVSLEIAVPQEEAGAELSRSFLDEVERLIRQSEYFQLARFLQPAMVVIEDVDLIARAREQMRSACEESLLNKLLNEMDGLREDAFVLFVRTTNRPDQLETALASRPGRIDQAIEFPLPDEPARRKLVQLYSRGVPVPEIVTETIVAKTKKASAAFIKELMRRAAQYQLQEGNDRALAVGHVESALEEMLFSGGSLNVKLLGGAVEA